MPEARMPEWDPGRIAELQRRNFEAMIAANRILAESVRKFGEKQLGLFQMLTRETLQGWRELAQPDRAAPDIERQIESWRGMAEQMTRHLQELAELALETQTALLAEFSRTFEGAREPGVRETAEPEAASKPEVGAGEEARRARKAAS